MPFIFKKIFAFLTVQNLLFSVFKSHFSAIDAFLRIDRGRQSFWVKTIQIFVIFHEKYDNTWSFLKQIGPI